MKKFGAPCRLFLNVETPETFIGRAEIHNNGWVWFYQYEGEDCKVTSFPPNSVQLIQWLFEEKE